MLAVLYQGVIMHSLDIEQFPCLSDNYGFLVRDRATGITATVDTPDADAISRAVDGFGGRLDFILNTHHHPDHVGGNLALKERWGCTIIGPAGEAARIPGIDRPVGEGARVLLGQSAATVMETPGHTLGHIVFHFADARVAFVGDTLFALGCGRLFEGTPAQMWGSLKKLRALPDDTTLYCAHEYTLANARFARAQEPDHATLKARAEAADMARRAGQPTVPMMLRDEKAANPFLRADDPALAAALGLEGRDAVTVFTETRARKDRF